MSAGNEPICTDGGFSRRSRKNSDDPSRVGLDDLSFGSVPVEKGGPLTVDCWDGLQHVGCDVQLS